MWFLPFPVHRSSWMPLITGSAKRTVLSFAASASVSSFSCRFSFIFGILTTTLPKGFISTVNCQWWSASFRVINPKLSSEFCVGPFADLTKCVVEILLNELSTVTVFYGRLSVGMKVGLEPTAVPSTREHLIINSLKEKKSFPDVWWKHFSSRLLDQILSCVISELQFN